MKLLWILPLLFLACQSTGPVQEKASLSFPGEEKHLRNIRQLTFGGQNAEAYFSPDGEWLVFQSQRDGYPCDELYRIRVDGTGLEKLSTGEGRVTCGYYLGQEKVIFASTHDHGAGCPAKPDFSRGYVWPIYGSYELYTRNLASGELQRLTNDRVYDAEATVSRDQKEVVFTSTRHGDLDLYVMDADGSNVRRVTKELGYDGGAFFSHDGKRLIYRAYHPSTDAEKREYRRNLKAGVYRPSWLELFIIDKDGKNRKQITKLKGGTFAPFLFPGDQRVIFSSNYKNPRGRTFDLYAINVDGTGLEQITFSGTFDSFPMFSPDGKRLVWASNRNGKVPGETNLFIADWVD